MKSSSILEKVIYVWQLPQNIIGHSLSKKCKFRFKLNHYSIYELSENDGMSLGNYIFINPNCSEGILLKHEYGHCLQSKLLGWLYLPIIFIPSYCWYLYFCRYCSDRPNTDYYRFYTERWADNLVARRKSNITHTFTYDK